MGLCPSGLLSYWTISHWTKAHCLIWQCGQKPTSLEKISLSLFTTVNEYVGSAYFGGFKILNFNIFGGFRKLNIFGGMKILRIFLGVITKLDYTMHFRVFSEGQGTKWKILFGLLKFQIFIWGA